MKQLSVILAAIPFVVVIALFTASETASGWDGLGYFIMALLSGPFLVPLSIISTYLSFKKDKETGESMKTPYKVVSVLSLICMSLLSAAGVAAWFMMGLSV